MIWGGAEAVMLVVGSGYRCRYHKQAGLTVQRPYQIIACRHIETLSVCGKWQLNSIWWQPLSQNLTLILVYAWKKESEVTQSCLTLCDPMDCSLPGSSVHGIFQARILEWVPLPCLCMACPLFYLPFVSRLFLALHTCLSYSFDKPTS